MAAPKKTTRKSGPRVHGYPPFYDETKDEDLAVPGPWTPVPNQPQVYWYNQISGPGWAPYIIRCESFADPWLVFRFQKPRGWGDATHTINVDEQRLVWRDSPSTLFYPDGSPIEPGDAAFLFLTDKLETEAPPLWNDGHRKGSGFPVLRAGPGTGGSGKWPSAAGDGRKAGDKVILAMEKVIKRKHLSTKERRLVEEILESGRAALD